MSWLNSIAVAILAAATGSIASGFVASLAVSWYKISGREGNSGYFVVFIALGGLIGGLIIGLVTSRVIGAGANPGFLKAVGTSLAITAGIVALGAVPARLLADVAPTVDGEALMLIVEARWPATQIASPAATPGISYLELGSLTRARVQRISQRGPLWKEDAHQVDGRWTATGAVPVFTERGTRVVSIALNDSTRSAFTAKLPARPTRADFEWSEWSPRDGKGGPVRTDMVNFRFRVQKVSEPVRTEHFGNFDVSMIPQYFQQQSAPGTTTLEAWSNNFVISYKGTAATLPDGSHSPLTFKSGAVATLQGVNPTLLASPSMPDRAYGCSLLIDDHGQLRLVPVAACVSGIEADEVTSDSARFHEVKTARLARGHLDRLTYANAKHLLFREALLSVENLHVQKFSAAIDRSTLSIIPGVPPLGISPDGRSVIQYAETNGSVNEPVLVVTDVVADKVVQVPIDQSRMRFGNTDDLTAGWLNHHFTWTRRSDGVDALVARESFIPVPYHGNTSVEGGEQEYYKVDRGGEPVRMALIGMLQKDFGATRDTTKDTSYAYLMLVKGVRVHVSTSGAPDDYVMMSLDYGEPPSKLVGELGKAFDAVLATGKYDAALAPSNKK